MTNCVFLDWLLSLVVTEIFCFNYQYICLPHSSSSCFKLLFQPFELNRVDQGQKAKNTIQDIVFGEFILQV